MKRPMSLAAVLGVLVLANGRIAAAADNPAWTWCQGGAGATVAQQISGCSTVIATGNQPPAAVALAYYQRAALRQDRRELAAAVADFDQAIKRVPTFVEAYMRRAGAEYSLGDRARAIDDYSRAIALKPQAAVPYNNRCWVRAETGQMLDAALADCDQALRLRPSFATALGSRAYVNFRLGRFDQAVADDDAALKLDDANDALRAGALYVRGVAEMRTGDLGGQLDLATAEAIDPHVGATYAVFGVKP